MRPARFIDFCAAHYPNPADLLDAFFGDAVKAAASVGGLLDTLPELDGEWHYIPSLNGKAEQKCSYVGDRVTDKEGTWPHVTFHGFRGGVVEKFNTRDLAFRQFLNSDRTAVVAVSAATLASRAAEREDRRKAEREQRAERERRQRERWRASAMVATIAWEAASERLEHAYLTRKAVGAYGLRVATQELRARLWSKRAGKWLHTTAVNAGDLLVPVHDESGALVNLQRVDSAGNKRFIAGGRAHGCHHRIEGTTGRVVLCEGYATGATWHEATGDTVVLAFSANSLPIVAGYVGAALVAADNDEKHAGKIAAKATGLPYLMPATVGQDWNDAGPEAVRAAVRRLARATVPTSTHEKTPRAEHVPIFTDLASLPRVELTGREQVWFNKLAKECDPLQAAAIAWAICRKRAVAIPTQTTLPELLERIQQAGADRVHSETLARMGRALGRWNAQRHTRALSHISVSRESLRRHRHEILTELPNLTAADYTGVLLLWAPMASGKTQRIGKPFAEWARDQGRFVATCHRRSLVSELAERLSCDHYGEVNRETAHSVDALATCLPSIIKGAHRQIIDNCDYLFIDEIAQVLRFLESDKTCRTEEGTNADVYDRLRDLVSCARCVIGADAGMDDRVVEFLESCRPNEQFRIIEVRPRVEGLSASVGYGADAVAAVYGEMCARISDGQRIWISCESEKRVGEVARLLEITGARVLAVTASNRGNAKQAKFWKNPERVSRQYDAVVHSPVISSGMSIEHKECGPWFDHGFFIGGGHAITPADSAQMMRRVRYLRRWSVALVANTMRGLDDPEGMLLGMEAAAATEGTTAMATGFDAFVAGIRAENTNARTDFAAGLLWVLQRAGFVIDRLPMNADAPGANDLQALRADLDAERRAAIMAARDLTDDEARRLRSAEQRTQEQSDALTNYVIRNALGVETVTDEALDVWDDGRGPRRLDRFSAAVFGTADKRDATKHMTHRRFSRARVTAYRYLFEGVEISPGLRVADEVAELLISRVIDRRHLLAWLGIVPSRFGAFTGNAKDGAQKPFPMPKAPQKDVGEIFRAMGLKLRRRQNRHDGTKCYELQTDAFQGAKEWAERRNSHICRHYTLDKNTASVTVEPADDDAFWHGIRLELWSQADQISSQRAKALILAHLKSRGVSREARKTIWWWKNILPQRCTL